MTATGMTTDIAMTTATATMNETVIVPDTATATATAIPGAANLPIPVIQDPII